MKNLIENIVEAKGDQWFGFIAISAIAGLALLLLTAIYNNHEVNCYYPTSDYTSAGFTYMIEGSVNWAPDITAYYATDSVDMLHVLSTLKVCADKNT